MHSDTCQLFTLDFTPLIIQGKVKYHWNKLKVTESIGWLLNSQRISRPIPGGMQRLPLEKEQTNSKEQDSFQN